MQKNRIAFTILSFLAALFVTLNIYLSQSVSPLFSDITLSNNKEAAITFLKKIKKMPEFNMQFLIFSSQFGKSIDREVYADTTQNKKQIPYYRELLKKNPLSRDVLFKLALLYKVDGNIEVSRSYYKNASQIDPELPTL